MHNITDAATARLYRIFGLFDALTDAQLDALTYTTEELELLLRAGLDPDEVRFDPDGGGQVSPAGLREVAETAGARALRPAILRSLEHVPDFSFQSPAPPG